MHQGIKKLLLLGAGLMASLGQLSMSQAYAWAPPGLIGPVAYLAIVFGGIIAWLRWDEVPSSASLLGAGLMHGDVATVAGHDLADQTGANFKRLFPLARVA